MRTRDWVTAGFGFAALAVAVLAAGGAMRWAQAIVALLVAGALIPQLRSRSTHERISPLVAILAAAAALATLQLVPLPGGLLEHLNGTATALRDDGAALAGVSPWNAITLDAPATLRALGMFFTLVGIAIVCLRMSATERGRYRLVAAVVTICAITALVTIGHKLVGAELLYGIYDPRATPAVLGPLLNENHLGGLMAVGATAALGLVMYRRQRSWLRVSWLVCVGLCGVVVMLSQSRGATLALIAGLFVTGATLLGQRFASKEPRRGRARFVTSSLPIGVVAASAIVIVVYSTAGGLQRELDKTTLQEVHAPTSKFAAWKSATSLVEEAPWFGVGRGGMESNFTRVHPSSGFVTFSHLENEYLQTVVDFGIVGTILLGICSLWLASVAMRRWRDGPLAAAALGGVACVLLQSSVDFGIQLLGLAVPVTILASTLTYTALREGTRAALVRSRAARIGVVIVLCTAAATLFTDATMSIDEDRNALSERRGSLTLADIEPAITRHPLDYYAYALAADTLSHHGDNRAIRFLNHAMRLHPTHPGLHRVAARMLYRTGHKEQATIEYAAALRYTYDPTKLLAEIVTVLPSDQALEAIPTTLDMHVVVRALRDLKQQQLAGLWISRILVARPHSTRACDLWFDVLLAGVDLPLESGARCLEMNPERQTRLALAHVLINKGKLAEAIRLINDVETWTGRIDERASAWLTLCDVHAARKDYAEATRCLRRLDASGDLRPDQRPAIQGRLEQIEKNRIAEDLEKQKAKEAPKPATGSATKP